jgi:hypothetical protein
VTIVAISSRLAGLRIAPLDFWRDMRARIEISGTPIGSRPAGLIVTLFIIAVYNLIFYNRYLPVTEGWFSVYAVSMLHGQVPYRDFYLLLPPLYTLKLAAFIHFFGESIIALRIMGIILILAMAATLFLIFSRYFSSYVAAFVSIVAIIYYQSRNEHITYDFTQFLTFYALLSAYLLIVAMETTKDPGVPDLKSYGLFFASGVSAALMILTKQSNGALIFLFLLLPFVVAAIRLGPRFTLVRAGLFLFGAAVPVVIVCAWLFYEGALYPFWHQVFSDAVSTKGTLGVILFSWTKPFLDTGFVNRIGALSFFVVLLVYAEFVLRRLIAGRRLPMARATYFYYPGIVLLMGLAIFIPLFYPSFAPARFGWKLMRNAHFVAAGAAAVFFVMHLADFTLGKATSPGLFVVSAFSMGLVFGNGTSAGVTQISLFLPLGLLLCYLLFAPSFLSSVQIIVIALSFIFTCTMASAKFAHPYDWWQVSEPDIRTATVKPGVAGLGGFVLSPTTANAFATVTSIIKAHTTGKDAVFTFPNIPIFYLLTDRWPKTKAKVHWFDFLSDAEARKDAALLRDNPPKIIVNLELPEDVWRDHEILFRGGKTMGQREILRAIDELTTHSGNYVLEASIALPTNCSLKVWRRDSR